MRAPIAAVVLLALAGCSTGMGAFDRGLALYRQGRYAEARAAFDEAIGETPDSAAAWTNRGIARVRLGDLDGALQPARSSTVASRACSRATPTGRAPTGSRRSRWRTIRRRGRR